MSRVAALILTLVIVTDSRADEPLPTVADFSLTDQNGGTVTLADLRGKVWVASFIFTRCNTGCPQLISGSLMDLQRELAGKDDVRIVSFTVDPDHDRPEILKAFAESHGSDPSRWLWLTGNRDELYRLIRESFFLAVEENQGAARTPGNEFVHSTRLVLVDRDGRIRGYFEGRPTNNRGEAISEMPKLKAALDAVYREGQVDFPAINAGLNAMSGILLLTGYAAIRRRHVHLHVTCMLSALVVSAVFLTSYLYYHIVVRHGQPTRFSGDGAVRVVYFAILGSHTILAAIVAPLALFTACQGLCGNLARHVRVARWTLPIWIYVSVTGVIVYWMLYQVFPAQ